MNKRVAEKKKAEHFWSFLNMSEMQHDLPNRYGLMMWRDSDETGGNWATTSTAAWSLQIRLEEDVDLLRRISWENQPG